MANSIGDWYANASARERGGLQHDWENDDPFDRGPDPWFADLPPRAESGAGPYQQMDAGRQPATRRPSKGVPAPRPGDGFVAEAQWLRADLPQAPITRLVALLRSRGWPGTTEDRLRWALRQPAARPAPAWAPSRPMPPRPNLAVAAHRSQAQNPAVGIRQLTARLRRDGWPYVTENQVRAALATRVAPARQPSAPRQPVPAPSRVVPRDAGTGGPAAAPVRPRASSRRPSGLDDTLLAVAVQTILAVAPKATVDAMVNRIRRCGWPTATRAEVTQALSRDRDGARRCGISPMAVAVGAVETLLPPTVSIRHLSVQIRRCGWPEATEVEVHAAREEIREVLDEIRAGTPAVVRRAANPDGCPSCGVVPSALGTCRCS